MWGTERGTAWGAGCGGHCRQVWAKTQNMRDRAHDRRITVMEAQVLRLRLPFLHGRFLMRSCRAGRCLSC